MDIVGLVPAAGKGTRLGTLAFSKELFPVGFGSQSGDSKAYPKVVSQYLLNLFKEAGVEQVYFILRNGKWDIPAFYGDGATEGLNIAYLLMNLPYGTPFSLDQAYTFVKDKQVVFGFPDILIEPDDVFTQLLNKSQETKADIVLGTFDIPLQQNWDIVNVNPNGEIYALTPIIAQENNSIGWAVATWSPRFTTFMHEYLQLEFNKMKQSGNYQEISMGAVLQAALSNGFKVQSVYFSAGKCLDIGTPENLRQAVRSLY